MKIILLLLISFCTIFASIGKITSVKGKANIQRGTYFTKAVIGYELESKDIISTKDNSYVKVKLNDNTIISIGKNSALNIEEFVYDAAIPASSKTNLNFFKGAFKTITGKIGKLNPSKFKLKTKTASIGIRGTIIVGNQRKIACTQGSITVSSGGKTVIVNEGQVTRTPFNQPPADAAFFKETEIKELQKEIEPLSSVNSINFSTTGTITKDSVSSVSAANGAVAISEDGEVTYTPEDGFRGTDTITVTTTLKDGITTTETVTVTVTEDDNMELNLESTVITRQNITIDESTPLESTTVDTQTEAEPVLHEEEAETQELAAETQTILNDIATQTIIEETITASNAITNNTGITSQAAQNDTALDTWSHLGFNYGTGSLYMKGNITYFFNNNITVASTPPEFFIDINREAGSVDAGMNNDYVPMGIEGDPTSYYYLNDDQFGAKGDPDNYGGTTLDPYPYSFMKSYPDDIDTNGNLLVVDNESSWGYWLSSYNNRSAASEGFWVAGLRTNEDIVNGGQAYINNLIASATSTQMTFNGHTIGAVREGTTTNLDPIVFDTSNYMNLSFDFGSGTNNFSGTFGFNTSISKQSWSGTINAVNGSLTNSGFSSTGNVVGTGEGNTIVSSSIDGEYYGTETIKSVGGTFEFGTGSHTAFGVFKADRQ